MGLRIRHLRKQVARISIEKLSVLADISKMTLSYWENGKLTSRPIQKEMMQRLLNTYRTLGIETTERWIREGEDAQNFPTYHGEPINFQDIYLPLALSRPILGQNVLAKPKHIHDLIPEELQPFIQSDRNAIVTQVTHTKFYPLLEPGTWVGGIWQETLLAQDTLCIVQMNKEHLMVDIIKATAAPLFSSTQSQYVPQKLAKISRVWKI
jgi:transcriptional regulator with XRE-family HTH domain